jgi:hypothetical protein
MAGQDNWGAPPIMPQLIDTQSDEVDAAQPVTHLSEYPTLGTSGTSQHVTSEAPCQHDMSGGPHGGSTHRGAEAADPTLQEAKQDWISTFHEPEQHVSSPLSVLQGMLWSDDPAQHSTAQHSGPNSNSSAGLGSPSEPLHAFCLSVSDAAEGFRLTGLTGASPRSHQVSAGLRDGSLDSHITFHELLHGPEGLHGIKGNAAAGAMAALPMDGHFDGDAWAVTAEHALLPATSSPANAAVDALFRCGNAC